MLLILLALPSIILSFVGYLKKNQLIIWLAVPTMIIIYSGFIMLSWGVEDFLKAITNLGRTESSMWFWYGVILFMVIITFFTIILSINIHIAQKKLIAKN